MKPLTLEIHGTGTHNRGAELMAIAIAERMRATFPGVRLVVPPRFGDVFARARHHFLTTLELPGRYLGRITSLGLRFGAPSAFGTFGIVPPEEVDAVLDASGFAFGDQWGSSRALSLQRKMSKRSRKGQALILLPQALGSFSDRDVAAASRILFQRATLVCARDSQSYTAAKDLGVPPEILRQFPDFTVGIVPILPLDIQLPQKFSAIVPNIHMLNKGSSPAGYLSFVSRSIELLRARGMNPVFVVHDAHQDREVISQVRYFGDNIPVISHADPRALKAILGRATLVVGSRFHALVSSMAQGVPCIGVGWSHKYPELFSEFDCPDLLIPDVMDTTALEEAVGRLCAPAARLPYQERIAAAAAKIKDANERMWHEVEAILRPLCKS